ncbi:hypothetical protein ACP70R_000173 [Stipagrostis hirtigluma subsp. patula]
MATSYKPWFLVACTLFLAASCNGLQVGFYQKTCPRAEAIVRAEVKKAVRRDPGLGAALIRMLFHDCFVQGCDGSILLDRTPANPLPEKMGAPNNPSQRGFDVIDAAKAALEKACPGTVSCADIIAFGARDASSLLSGSKISFQMPAGRFDGRRSLESDTGGALPGPSSDLSTLLRRFADKGLTADDLVVLSGAHSIGRSHCTSFFRDRIASPSDMAAPLVSALRRQCPTNPTFTNNAVVAEDAVTPNVLDNQYYTNVLQSRVLFPSDAALLSSRQTASMVQSYARSPGLWERKFAAAMVKMASIEVKTARNGEIRRSCKVVN